MDEQMQVLRDVFGGSSSDSDDEQPEDNKSAVRSVREGCELLSVSSTIRSRSWERIEEIKGLWLCREFLSLHQQLALISSIENELFGKDAIIVTWIAPTALDQLFSIIDTGISDPYVKLVKFGEGWFAVKCHNQAMRFGDLPQWAVDLANSVREAAYIGDDESEMMDFVENHDNNSCVFPSQLLWREPLFDQIIVNVYQPGEGICAHVDLMRFDDGIAIVSLESPCVMHFSRVDLVSDSVKDGAEVSSADKVPVYLTPGSLVIMWGDARYRWKHEINRKPGFQVWEGQEMEQKKRTSVTLRKLRCSE